MSIRQGDRAVGFELPAKFGETVDIKPLLGKQSVVLLFFPFAFSPVCTEEMCTMRDGWKRWSELDASIFGITADSPFITDKFRQDEQIPFPILSDFNREVAGTYGVLHEDLLGLKGVPKRAAFVIDGAGRVAYSWVSEDPRVQVKFDEIEKAVQGVGVAGKA